MPWVLDGNNLAGGSDRERVRRAALALARAERVRLVVFFDGAPPAGAPDVERLGGVEVRYAVHADDAILRLLAGGGRGWKLATDDRGLAARARERGADVVGAAAFWRRAESVPPPAEAPRIVGGAGAELRRLREETERLPEAPRRIVRRPRRKG